MKVDVEFRPFILGTSTRFHHFGKFFETAYVLSVTGFRRVCGEIVRIFLFYPSTGGGQRVEGDAGGNREGFMCYYGKAPTIYSLPREPFQRNPSSLKFETR